MNDSIVTPGLASERPLGRLHIWPAFLRALRIALVCLVLAATIPSEGYLGASAYRELTINQAIGGLGFRLGAWEVSAWRQKIADAVERPAAQLSPARQHDLVVSYFANIGQIDRLNGQITHIYADPKQTGGTAAAAPLQAELDRLRAEQARNRPTVEQILQDQVAAVLRENGLTTAGTVFPPVLFHFSESPDVLIVSPRNHIELEDSAFMQPGASVGQMEHVEGQVEKQLDVSALVDGTGGFSAYPTMVVEYADLEWVLSTISHEWFHTYLAFRPLGWHYFDNGDTRTLNETAATIFGDEMGAILLAKFYPERVPPPPAPAPAPARAPAATPAGSGGGQTRPPEFSYGATMRATRLHVDDLLAHGKIAEAEAYMESQRELIVSHGYALRKLNQAYFAFHGSYAVGPAATDPIGDKLRSLRQHSGSLLHFVDLVSGITTVQDLDRVLATMR